MSLLGILAKGRGTGLSSNEQQKNLALKRMNALSDEVEVLKLRLANKRLQLDSATKHAKDVGALEPKSRRASLVSIGEQGNQSDRRRGSKSRDFCYKIKEIHLRESDCDITIEQGPCIIKIGISHFTRSQDYQAVTKLASDVKAMGMNWGAIGVLLSKFNRAHAVQPCGSDTYTLVPVHAD